MNTVATEPLPEPGAACGDGEARCGSAGAQRPLPLRQREEVQEVLRVSLGRFTAIWQSRFAEDDPARSRNSAP